MVSSTRWERKPRHIKARDKRKPKFKEKKKRKKMSVMVDGVNLKRVGDEYFVIEFYKIDLEKEGEEGVSKCCDHRLVSVSNMLEIVRLRLYVYVIPAFPPPPPLIHGPQFVCDPTETLTASGGMCSFNLNTPAHQWKAYPLPNRTRHNFFHAVILCQEIYCISDLSRPQVFCRGSRKWIPLDAPPHYLNLHQFMLITKSFADDANGRIFIFHRKMGEDTRLGDIYAWYPNRHLARKSSGPVTEEWECVASNFPQWTHLTTFEDGVFYFHHRKASPYFSAYHVNSKQWLDVEWSSPFTYELSEMKDYVDMKHMSNGKLCLLAHRNLYPDNDGRIHGSRIYVVSFQFQLSHDTPLVTFRHISTKLYDLPGVGEVYNLLPLGKEKEGDGSKKKEMEIMVMAAEKEERDGSKKKMEIIFRGYEEKLIRHKLNYRCNKFYKVDLNNEGVEEICKPLLISSCAITMFCGGSYLFIAETRPWNLDLIPDSIVVQDDKEDNSKEMKIPCLKVISRIDISKKPLHHRKWVSAPSPYDHVDGSTLNFAALNNNIYCLGVISTPQVHTLVKGMEEKPWLHLTPPPSDLIGERLNITDTIIPDPANNRILVHLTKGLNCSCGAIFGWHYNSEDRLSRWHSVATYFNRWDSISTVADNFIFSFDFYKSPQFFIAYDLSTEQWMKIEWSSPCPHFATQIREFGEFRGMMYLGNQVLCLAATALLFHPEKCTDNFFGSRVYFLHFKFERSDDGSTITFTHQFNKSYDVPDIMGIQNFLLLD